MRRTVVPLLKNSLFALFLLLVSPLFFSPVATGQVVGCSCESMLPVGYSSSDVVLEHMTGDDACCFLLKLPAVYNPCESSITSVSYQLPSNFSDCLGNSYDVWTTATPPTFVGSFIPNSMPVPFSLPSAISSGTTFPSLILKMCPSNPSDPNIVKCPCHWTFDIDVTFKFADGTQCTIRRKGKFLESSDLSCCSDLHVGVSSENTNDTFGVSLSPNPTQSKITVSFSQTMDTRQKYSIQIVDLQGNILENQIISLRSDNSISLDISLLSSGSYQFIIRDYKNTLIGSKRFSISR